MTDKNMKAELERLRAENEALKAGKRPFARTKVGTKKGVSYYLDPGQRRFPVSMKASEWLEFFEMSGATPDEAETFYTSEQWVRAQILEAKDDLDWGDNDVPADADIWPYEEDPPPIGAGYTQE